MSYDLYAVCPRCEQTLTQWGSCTSNLAPMWREAGCDLADFDGRPVSACLPILRVGIAAMEADPDRFRALNPDNGWGRFDDNGEDDPGLLTVLRKLAADWTWLLSPPGPCGPCHGAPVVRVSR